MADEKPAGNPFTPIFFIIGLLVVLAAIWWVRGGPNQQADSGTPTTSQTDTGTNVDTSATNQY